jgi:hypothetical protein
VLFFAAFDGHPPYRYAFEHYRAVHMYFDCETQAESNLILMLTFT